MLSEWIKLFENYVPSLMGAAGSLLWLKGSFFRKFWLFALGAYSGYHLGFFLNEITEVPLNISWLTMGLYSVSIFDKFFDFIDKATLSEFLPFLKSKSGDGR